MEVQQGFPSSSIIKLCSIVGSIETWREHKRFYFSKYSVVVCHKLSEFNSQVFTLHFIWNCCSLMDQVSELFRRPRTMLKIQSFSGDHKFFQKSPQIISSMIRVANFFIYWPGRHNLELGIHFQQIDEAGWPPGCISTEHFDRVRFL